jgi:flavin-dependent dehydrogenase
VVEVLITGAGPAGAAAAIILARAGVRVLLVDRAKFPRDKLCGDTVNPGALAILQRLGVDSRLSQQSLRLDGMIVTGGGGARVRGEYGRGRFGRSVRRRDLDAWLVSAAIEAGAKFEEGVQAHEAIVYQGERGPEVRGALLTGRDGRRLRVPALVTIAADGRRSALAFGLGLARHPDWPRRWAAGGYFEAAADLSSFGEMHVRAGHYIGVAPVPGGLANACLVTAHRRGFDDPAGLLRDTIAADPLLRDRFAGAKLVTPVVSLGPLAVDATAAGMPGLLLAGDAAGFIDPMTGDGLRFALRGGELAARAAYDAVQRGVADAHVRLDAWRRVEFAGKQRFDRALRRLVDRPAALRAAAIGARLAPWLLRRVIAIAGDVEPAARRAPVS